MDLLRSFIDYVEKGRLFDPAETLLLAVSGGIDSIVLADLCHRAGYTFVIAHANFQLRGEESTRDEQFIRSLSTRYKVVIRRFETETYAEKEKRSIQVAARELRYNWFRELAVSENIEYILTAHHQDDNIETVLMNFFKGAGIAGLRGILPKQANIVRPLLFATREQITAYAKAQQLEWVEDSSNTSDKYTRNYFRHQIIPLVNKLIPEAQQNLADNIGRFREIEELYRQAIDAHKKSLLEYKGDEIHIPVLKLKKAAPLTSILYEILQPYSFSPQQAAQAVNLLDSETGKFVKSQTHRIFRNRNWLIIAPLDTGLPGHILIERPETLTFSNRKLSFETIPASTDPKEHAQSTALLDADQIKFPLILRPWTAGDYFYPLGMRKKKKLARFLIDAKLSLAEKQSVRVLEMDKKIIWVVGMRIDDRFKVRPGTRNVLKIETGLT